MLVIAPHLHCSARAGARCHHPAVSHEEPLDPFADDLRAAGVQTASGWSRIPLRAWNPLRPLRSLRTGGSGRTRRASTGDEEESEDRN